MKRTILSILTVYLAAVLPVQAYETFPLCDTGSVIAKVKNRFNNSQRYGRAAGVEIVAIDAMSERHVEFFGLRPIPRRYCKARAHLADGGHRTLYYLVEGMMGLAGTGYNVEFCLLGHDPWRVYDGGCRVLRR